MLTAVGTSECVNLIRDFSVSELAKKKLLMWLQIASAVVVLSIPPAGWVIKLYLDKQFTEQQKEIMEMIGNKFITFNDARDFASDDEFSAFKTKTNGVLQAFQANEYVSKPVYDVNRLSDKIELSALKEDLAELKAQGKEQSHKLDRLLEMVLTNGNSIN